MVSCIIPVYNEEKLIKKTLDSLSKFEGLEIIVVDGGSSDRSVDIVNNYSVISISSPKGRSSQMNAGAGVAKGDILLFLHADNVVFSEALVNIEKEVQQNGVVGGCLTQKIDKKGFIFRVIEAQGNIRARMSKVFYGDQGIFVRKDVFFRVNGFPEVPIFEDALFTRKLRQEGKTAVLSDKIIVSPRRWEKRGIIKTMIMYNTLLVMLKIGFPLERIKALYEDLR